MIRRNQRKCRWGPTIALALLLAVTSVASFFAPSRLQAQQTDAVVVLAGVTDGRHELGARVVKDGVSNSFVVSNPLGEDDLAGYAHCAGESQPEGAQTFCLDPQPVTTAGEVAALNALAQEQEWDSVVVVTNRPHRHRVAAMMWRGSDLEVDLVTEQTILPGLATRLVVHEIGGLAKFAVTDPC